jgi:hypothetical protein
MKKAVRPVPTQTFTEYFTATAHAARDFVRVTLAFPVKKGEEIPFAPRKDSGLSYIPAPADCVLLSQGSRGLYTLTTSEELDRISVPIEDAEFLLPRRDQPPRVRESQMGDSSYDVPHPLSSSGNIFRNYPHYLYHAHFNVKAGDLRLEQPYWTVTLLSDPVLSGIVLPKDRDMKWEDGSPCPVKKDSSIFLDPGTGQVVLGTPEFTRCNLRHAPKGMTSGR